MSLNGWITYRIIYSFILYHIDIGEKQGTP